MTGELDEGIAWQLLLGVVPVPVGATAPQRISVQQAWLDVDPTGKWRSSHSVSKAARDLFNLYLPLRLNDEIVIGQLGQSLDGRIATPTGASHYVTGPADIERLHRVRSLVDAVVVGAGTVAADDPQLTVRRVKGHNPVRVLLDPRGRLDQRRRVFTDGEAPTLVVRSAGGRRAPSERDANDTKDTKGAVEVLEVPWDEADGFDLPTLLGRLRARGLRRILVEGGGRTVSGFLGARLLDRLHVTVAPMLIGSGPPAVNLAPIETLDQAIRAPCRTFDLGRDVLFDLDLRGIKE